MTREKPQIYAPAGSPYIRAAKDAGVEAPRLVRVPQKLPKFLDAPHGDDFLGDTPRAVLKNVLWDSRIYLIFSLITSVGLRLSGMAMPVIMGHILDSGIERGPGVHLLPWSIALLVAIGVIWIMWALDQIANVTLSFRLESYVRRAVATRAVRNGTAISSRYDTGNILTIVTDDAAALGMFTIFMPPIAAAIITILIAGWIMISSSLLLGLLVMFGLPVAVFGVSVLAKPLKARQSSAQNARGKLNTVANDAVLGLRVLRGVGGQGRFVKRYEKMSADVLEQGIRVVPYQATMASLRVAVPALFQTIIVAVGAWQVFTGKMSAGTLLAFFGMTAYLQAATNTIVTAAGMIVNGTVGAGRIAKLMAIKGDFPTTAFNTTNPTQEPDELNHLAPEISHPPSGIKITPGTFNAIVAQDTAAADAIMQEMAALVPASRAEINGEKLTALPLKWVRRNIMYSHGEGGLFAGSLRSALLGSEASAPPPLATEEILAWYQVMQTSNEGDALIPDFQSTESDQCLLQALEIAQCGDVYSSLGETLDGQLLEKGRNLSGGQRQRLILARAVAANPPVLLLSEPTSALDARTEAAVAQSLAQARQGQTTLVLSASPLLLRWADTVTVLANDGTVCATATPAELSNPSNNSAGALIYRNVISRDTGESAPVNPDSQGRVKPA